MSQTENDHDQKDLDAKILKLNPERNNVVTVNFTICEKPISKARAKLGLLPDDAKDSVTIASIEKLQNSSKLSLLMKAAGFKKSLRLLNPKVVIAIEQSTGVTVSKNHAALIGLALCILGTEATDAVLEEMVESADVSSLSDLIAKEGFDRALIEHLSSLFPVLEEIIELIKTFVNA